MKTRRFDLTTVDFKRNPFPTFARMRECGELIPGRMPLVGDVWMATTYESVTRILRDKETFVTEPRNAGRKNFAGIQWWMPRVVRSLTNNMLGKDEPDHRRLRELVESAFMRQSIDEMRPRLAALAGRQLDHMEKQAASNGGRVDFVQHFARPFPVHVISELLGFPEEDRPKFQRWASGMTSGSTSTAIVRFIPAILKLNRYFLQQFEEVRQRPRPGMLTALVQAEQEGRGLSKAELLASTFLLLFAGHETTVHLLSGGVLTLLQHPREKAALMADWSLGYSAVGEILRHFSSIQMTKPRYVSRDVKLFGQQLRRGEVVAPILAAANADPAEFPEPETFDIRRSPNRHLTFGTGMHVCLGSKLAWAEAEIAIEQLFTRYPNLQLACSEKELAWTRRLGTRAVTSLPLSLSTSGMHAAHDAA
jgi:cytochrome P450